jgi:hypothetical protein
MADSPPSKTAAHDHVSGHPHRPGTSCEHRLGGRHQHIAPQGTGGTAGARRLRPAAGNWFVGDDTPPNGLATGWWACPALGHSGRSTKNMRS